MSKDSIQQWMQVVGEMDLETQHPPIMTRLWWLVSLGGRLPSSLLFLHLLFYWAGMYGVTVGLFSRTPAQWFVVLVLGALSPLGILSVHIWKDVGMLASFLAATAMLANRRPDAELVGWREYLFYGLILYGAGVRYNAFPLALVLFYLDLRTSQRRRRKVTLFSISMIFMVLVQTVGVKSVKATNSIFLWDIAGIARQEKKSPVVERGFIEPLDSSQIRERVVETFSSLNCIPTIRLYHWKQEIPGVFHIWLSAVYRYPIAYLKHRLLYLKTLLGFQDEVHYPFHEVYEYPTVKLELSNRQRIDFRWRVKLANAVSDWWPFRPFIGLILCVLTMVYRIRRKDFAFYLALTGVLNFLTLVPLGMSPDYRYMVWTLVVGWIFGGRDLSLVLSRWPKRSLE